MEAVLFDDQKVDGAGQSATDDVLLTLPAGTSAGYGGRARKIIEIGEEITLPRRGITLLAGRNGEGKTTLMRYLCGCLPYTPNGAGARVSTVYLPEELAFDAEMPVKSIASAVLGRKALVEWFTKMSDIVLLDVRKRYGALSKGNKQKVRTLLSVAMARLKGADLLCVDEVMSGLDYAVRREFWKILTTQSTERHIVASLHPDDIDVEPVQTLIIARGVIRVMPSKSERIRWSDIEDEIERRRNEGGKHA